MSIEERRDSIIESFDQLSADEQNALLIYIFEKTTATRSQTISSMKKEIKSLEASNLDLYQKFNIFQAPSFAETV